MNQRLESEIDVAQHALKNTKAKMREVLEEIAAKPVEHEEPAVNTKVSIV